MKNVTLAIMVLASIIFAQTIKWEKSFPFETEDEAPVGIDITPEGNILIACYANGPNKCYWDDDTEQYTGPDTKLLILNSSGNTIGVENYGILLKHGVTGIGSTDTGYSIFGNFVDSSPTMIPSSAWIVRFNEEHRDTLKNNRSGFSDGYTFRRTKTSYRHMPVALMSDSHWFKSGSSHSVLVDTDNNYLLSLSDMETQFPDSLFFDPSDKWVQSFDIFDFDYNESSKMFIAGSLWGMSLNANYEFIIKLDIERNVIWQKYYYGYDPPEGQVSHLFSAISATSDEGCIIGIWEDKNNNFSVDEDECRLVRYDSEGNESYSISVLNRLDFIHRISENKYIYKVRGSSELTKIVDTGSELEKVWTSEFPGIRAIRPVENGFVAAGVKDGNIWVTEFDATTGIEHQSAIPEIAELYQNYPNPFNNSTLISYSVANTADVRLSVYNVKGELVRELVNRRQNKGRYSVVFKADDLNSGVYFCKLEIDGVEKVSRKMVNLK